MHVLKFGGTSMVDENSWRRVLDIISRYDAPVVVVSATARTTRQLVAAAETALANPAEAKKIGRAIGERHEKLVINFLEHSTADGRRQKSTDKPASLPPRKDKLKQSCINWIDQHTLLLNKLLDEIASQNQVSLQQNDAITSLGEQLSAYLFTQCGQAYGLPMEWTDARTIIKTDANYGSAQPDLSKIKGVVSILRDRTTQNIIPVVGGFYGENEQGHITTFGFEGSDYSASLIGGALNAEAVEIWTDVSGIYTCDPRVVASARPIDELSFKDATELASFGAKVLHPATMKPAQANKIPIYVKNIFEADRRGTKIHQTAADNGLARAMAYIENAVLLTINTANRSIRDHRLVEVFVILDEFQPAIAAINTKKNSVTVAVKNFPGLEDLERKLKAKTAVSKLENQGVISLIGCDKTKDKDTFKQAVDAAFSIEPTMWAFDEENRVFHIAIEKDNIVTAVKSLHRHIFEG